MTLPLVITQEAHEDIERNAVWWAQHHSVEQAIEWKSAAYEQIASIPLMPESYSLSVENPKFADEIRQKNVGLESFVSSSYHLARIFSERQRSVSERQLDLGCGPCRIRVFWKNILQSCAHLF